MTERDKLIKRLQKKRAQLETAILFFDTEAAEWLEEEINELEQYLKFGEFED